MRWNTHNFKWMLILLHILFIVHVFGDKLHVYIFKGMIVLCSQCATETLNMQLLKYIHYSIMIIKKTLSRFSICIQIACTNKS